MAQVLKVVAVWKTHKVYAKADLTELKEKLVAIQEAALESHSKPPSRGGVAAGAQASGAGGFA